MQHTGMASLRMCLIIALVLASNLRLPAAHVRTPPPSDQLTGTVRGKVVDFNGAAIVMPQPIVIFESRQVRKKVSPDENGDYEIELPAGVYQVSAEVEGFYPFRRAPFRVQPDTTLMINVSPTPRYLTRGTTVSDDRTVDLKADPPKYEEIPVHRLPAEPSVLLVEFDKRRKRKGMVEYHSATLSYDMLTVYADKIKLNRGTLRAEALGDYVIIEDGQQRVRVRRAEVDFRAGKPVISLTR